MRQQAPVLPRQIGSCPLAVRSDEMTTAPAVAAATVVTATEDAEAADEQTPNRLSDEFPAPIPS